MERRTVADVILAVEPEMRELIRLREEVVKLRIQTSPPTPTIAEFMADTPITVRRDDDGKWSSTIDLGSAGRTGTSGQQTDVLAFHAAIGHLTHLLSEAWMREAEGDD